MISEVRYLIGEQWKARVFHNYFHSIEEHSFLGYLALSWKFSARDSLSSGRLPQYIKDFLTSCDVVYEFKNTCCVWTFISLD